MDLQQFKQQVAQTGPVLNDFLEKLAADVPAGLPAIAAKKNEEVWAETDCLSCAHCCKTMTPAYSDEDVARISNHLGMDEDAFRRKYLLQYSNGEWVNLEYPCAFLGEDNRCSIYEVRPANCAGFPYHDASPFLSRKERFSHNMYTCPATFRLLLKLKEALEPCPNHK